jgi:hypothetical protein
MFQEGQGEAGQVGFLDCVGGSPTLEDQAAGAGVLSQSLAGLRLAPSSQGSGASGAERKLCEFCHGMGPWVWKSSSQGWTIKERRERERKRE